MAGYRALNLMYYFTVGKVCFHRRSDIVGRYDVNQLLLSAYIGGVVHADAQCRRKCEPGQSSVA